LPGGRRSTRITSAWCSLLALDWLAGVLAGLLTPAILALRRMTGKSVVRRRMSLMNPSLDSVT